MSQRKEMLMKNMEFVAYEGLNGKPGFQNDIFIKAKKVVIIFMLLVLDIMVLILLM